MNLAEVGKRLNTAHAKRCPRCGGQCQVSIHEKAAVWECGYIYPLPPLHGGARELRNCGVCHG